jgi:tetracycline 7-halogenase / FADH2 O2-dependent halogenase
MTNRCTTAPAQGWAPTWQPDLGAILARQGLSVLLVPSPDDATDLSGETTVPYTAEVFMLLAHRFGVPEIGAFGRFTELPADVRRRSGIKRSLGFLYHREGAVQNPRESVQFNVPGEHTEWHLYRPVVDEYAVELAKKYGAAVAGPDAEVAGAWVETGSGEPEGRVRTTDGDTYC